MHHTAMLRQAASLMQSGSIAEASALCRRVLQAAPGQPEALHLLALAAQRTGDPEAADALFRDSLEHAPRQPAVLVDFARFLRSRGQLVEAERRLRRAVELAPDCVPGWHNLGILLRAANELSEAGQCARRVTTLAPRNPAGWELLAAVEQAQGNPAAALAACREGLRQVPNAARLHYSLGQLLRQECSFAAAVAAYDDAQRHGFETPDLYQNRGEAYFEAGDGNHALASLNTGIARFPDNAMLHRLRARFHWEYGAPGDPLSALWKAVREHPLNGALWQTLVDFLNRLGRTEEGRAALSEARGRGCPQTPELLLLEALACAQEGDASGATRRFAQLEAVHPAHLGIRLAFAEHLLGVGDPARAESLCAGILAENPLAQLAWALRGTAWQLLGDAREAWLLDYEHMVMPVRVPPPPDYADSEAFFSAARAALESLHRMQAHPIEQTLRGGTQTNGLLFRMQQPLVRMLEAQLRIVLHAVLASLPEEAGHPFRGQHLSRARANGIRFAGSWSVRLKSQGFHTNHIHPEGWISSALYIALPDEVRAATDNSGSIQFGVPPFEVGGITLPARRVIKPKVGELVLFPSYMWHGTVPFTSEQPRITVAFDVAPQG